MYIGELFFNSSGQVEFKPTDAIPIRKYPVDNETRGALEIYTMPEKDSTGKVFDNRYSRSNVLFIGGGDLVFKNRKFKYE